MNLLQLSDYNYSLPEDRIADNPLVERDAARMLVYDQNCQITHSYFKNLPAFLPGQALLILNDTKVVHARLLFQKETWAKIEVFCLHPISPFKEMNKAMEITAATTWQCMVGNQKRWKKHETLTMKVGSDLVLNARLVEKMGREAVVEFIWQPASFTWAKILELAGKMPLPPYIHRDANLADEAEYQTVFASKNGAVAAPTAGLHFTKVLLHKLSAQNTAIENITLHVGAGTFQPVANENILEHPMHREQMIFEKKLIKKIAAENHYVIAAGTTSLRALESLYWFGNHLETYFDETSFFVQKLQPYLHVDHNISLVKSMNNIIAWMQRHGLETLHGETEIFIFPGYNFKVCRGLITNFHLPKSTLLMLVSAFVGEDWKHLYALALESHYRFLSYGDGMLLLR